MSQCIENLKTKKMNSIFFLLTCLCLNSCTARDTITKTQGLKDPETIVSSGGNFSLGFFSFPSSKNRYVGIWFTKPSVRRYIWVSNKNNPLNDSLGVLRISEDGNLRVENSKNIILWSTNLPADQKQNVSSAQIQDTGNLVLTSNNGDVIWQSFDHPVDCFLPKMNLPLTKGDQKRALRSWKSPSDPSEGPFTAGIDMTGLPQIVVWNGESKHWRSGPWNGNTFIGVQISYNDMVQNQLVVDYGNNGEIVVSYYQTLPVFTTYQLTTDGKMSQIWWDEGNKDWGVQWQDPSTVCDGYSKCGPFGTCNSKRTNICQCLKGFEPKNEQEWSKNNWSDGCVRRRKLQCESGDGSKEDGFLKLQMMKLPDHEILILKTQDECRIMCQNNCSCLAYAYDTYSGCMTWSSTLIDIQEFTIGGLDFYLRLSHSELVAGTSKKWKLITAIAGGSLGTAVIALLLCCLWKQKARQQVKNKQVNEDYYKTGEKKSNEKLEELPLFSFESLAAATNNFDESNKLGRGGFGSVYRGILNGGQEIAVKRLAKASRQGIEEFMNEVVVISKLQHRNLVRLIGCSCEVEEKMLVYEYLQNKSLDAYIFVPEKQKELDWNKRFNIIEGICRGLNYLHKGSRLKIIHRDLKASNILLDDELNPKISDFGMARIFGGDQDEADTRRIVGTYGYMSPEYAMQGLFSEKSDVFSFGVLLLEIISGQRKGIFCVQEQSLSLLGYAWNLWNSNDITKLIDPVISEPQHETEVSRCVHLGLLCVQEFAKDRPTMSTVISILNGEISDLPPPNKPGFASIFNETPSQQTESNPSVNFVSITQINGR